MEDPLTRGLVRRYRIRFYCITFGAALAYIIITMLLIIIFALLVADKWERNRAPIFTFFGLGFFTFWVYVNIMPLRRKFPFNWIFSCTIALLLALGAVSVLPKQEVVRCLLLTMEIIVLMALLILLGTWLPGNCHPLLFIVLATISIFNLLFALMSLVGEICLENEEVPIWSTHCVLWILMCPMLLFQSQVMNGYWKNKMTVMDMPLCAVLLLIDFLSSYAFLDAAEDIEFSILKMSSNSNVRLLKRLYDHEM